MRFINSLVLSIPAVVLILIIPALAGSSGSSSIPVMNEQLNNLLYGAIGGGVVAAAFKVIETYVVAPRMGEAIEARKKLFFYSKPFWLDCYELEYRLKRIESKDIGFESSNTGLLTASLSDVNSVDWFVTDGYCVTSTAYLLACVAAWIALFERDVAFLQFQNKSLTIKFFHLTQDLKNVMGGSNDKLRFYYISVIGEKLVKEGENKPMTFSGFIDCLYKDLNYRNYYGYLFEFINKIPSGEHDNVLKRTNDRLLRIRKFLEQNRLIPDDLAFRKM